MTDVEVSSYPINEKCSLCSFETRAASIFFTFPFRWLFIEGGYTNQGQCIFKEMQYMCKVSFPRANNALPSPGTEPSVDNFAVANLSTCPVVLNPL